MPRGSETNVHPEKIRGATRGSQRRSQRAQGPGAASLAWGVFSGRVFSKSSQSRVTVKAHPPAQGRVGISAAPAPWRPAGALLALRCLSLISDSRFHALGSLPLALLLINLWAYAHDFLSMPRGSVSLRLSDINSAPLPDRVSQE